MSYIEQASWYGTAECELFRRRIFERFPLIADDLARVYVAKASCGKKGYVAANNWLRQIPERLICGPWNVTHDDDALIDHAVAQARIVEMAYARAYGEDTKNTVLVPRTLPLITPVASISMRAVFLHRVVNIHRTAGMRRAVAVGERLCRRHQIEAPAASLSFSSRLARLMCSRWWRRRLRVLSGRRIEQLMRDVGRVHKRAGVYASDLSLAKRRSQKVRNNALLEAFVAINQNGEQYTLAELSELGLANPSHRYSEMMLRIRDTEAEALRLGHQGLFFTWTCPSKYHPVNSGSCKPNPKYNGATPRKAHKYLTKLWAKVRAKFGRENVGIYGMRVVEPHHDGTPHWHLMLWVKPESADYVTQVMRDYALAEDGSEPGAKYHRFDVEKIEQKKGGAISYLAKYVGKGVNHTKAGDVDQYGNDIATAANRIETWAATWGIRQFQFVGLPSVSVWRELRKINERTEDEFKQWQLIFDYEPAHSEFTRRLVAACDSGQWDQFMRLMGGPMVPMKDRPARSWTVDRPDTNRLDAKARGQYGEIVKATFGVTILGDEYLTRFNRWEVKHRRELAVGEAFKAAESGAGVGVKRAAGSPWIHVNNCTRPFGPPPVDANERIKIMVNNRWEELPAWRVAEKIDDYLLDSHHMQKISEPQPLSEDDKALQDQRFHDFVTSAEYRAEIEHAEQEHEEIKAIIAQLNTAHAHPDQPNDDNWDELREVLF
ncbi:hypothetical protein R84981_001147 [Carnimonas sp. R-84981]|uniref:replication endonuclease n=1 Tax=Carnimonas bestiolae TaxID=3402172 RepID=UPI003EDBA1C6